MLGPVEIVDEVDSTNAELLRRARAGGQPGQVLCARHQTAGRGRLDRTWEAPPGTSLLVSVLLRPALAVEDLHLLTAAAGLAALDACALEGERRAQLKWPNDVVVDDAKLAGLLAEAVIDGGAVTAVVVGMGLNVDWPGPVPGGGIALAQLVGHPVDPDALLHRWIEAFDERLDALATPTGRDAVRSEHRAACGTLGRRVRVEAPDGVVEGVAEDVDRDGRLVVVGEGRRAFSVGDVVHVRVSAD